MDAKEYFKAEESLEARYKTLTESSSEARVFRKALEEYFEALITVKGHAWCMDVRTERKKMSRLVVGACMSVLTLTDKIDTIRSNEISMRCQCGKDVILRHIGGQYKDSYAGRCTCGKGWFLTDLPAELPFS